MEKYHPLKGSRQKESGGLFSITGPKNLQIPELWIQK